MRLRTLIPAALATSIILAGCGGSDSADPTPTPPQQSTRTATAPTGGDTTPISSPATIAASPTPAAASATAGASPATSPTLPTSPEATPTQAVADTPVPPTPTQQPASGNPTSAAVGVTGTVRYFWAPASASIAPGGSVTFSWDSNAVHDLSISALGIATSPKKQFSQTVTFANPGSYAFVCEVHADTMAGTITVQ